MNLSLLSHEFKMLFTSKKNIIFSLFLLGVVLSFCLLLLPNQETTESFDPVEKQYELEELDIVQKHREKIGATGILGFTGQAVYATYANYYKVHNSMLNAFLDGNMDRYLLLRIYNLQSDPFDFYTKTGAQFEDSPFPGKDLGNFYMQTILTLQGYLDEDLPITYALIEEKTALQVLKNTIVSSLSLFFIFCAVYFSSDMLLRDRHNSSLLQGLPVSWYGLLNMKSFAAFIYTQLIIFALLAISVLTISIQNGFGYFNIQVPVMLNTNNYDVAEPEYMSIAKFLLLAGSFIPILSFLFIRINMVFNLLLRNEWVVLAASSLLLFSEAIYFTRTLRDIADINISFFPQTYFDFGKIVSGEKNYLVNIDTISYERGLTVLLITILLIEVLVFIVSKIINKRRFYQWNG